jgi:myo-inositol-1(or 4)-monophosphatase
MVLPNLDTLSAMVRGIARAELPSRFGSVQARVKADGSLVTSADRAMQAHLEAELRRQWPAFEVLSEEMSQERQERALERPGPGVWVVDPLDGTTNFAAGIPYFSVSVALLAAGVTAVGVVYDPVRDETFAAARGGGASLNGAPLTAGAAVPPMRSAVAAVDFKRLDPGLAVRLATAPPYGSQRSFGSVALDWCWIAAGRFHLYLHGRQRLWDYTAGELILGEAGGHSCTLQGEPVARASLAPRSAAAARDPDLFEAWRAWLARTG